MPAQRRSLAITDLYREKQAKLAAHGDHVARVQWARVNMDDLEGSHARWADAIAASTARLQQTGARLAAAYAAAFVGSELGRRVPTPEVPVGRVGQVEDGRPIREALETPIIKVRVGLKEGKPADEALSSGLDSGLFLAGGAAMWAARGALSDVMQADERIVGWRRVTSGGCGACIAAATGAIHKDDELIETHNGCQCHMEPAVRDVPDRFPRTTGPEIFNSLPKAEQDARLGEDAAELLRTGRISYQDLIAKSPMVAQADQLTQAPVEALT